MKTKNCVRCMKPAKFWCGHVLYGKKQVTAGWCSKRCYNVQGFRGIYSHKMDMKQENE